MVDVMAVLEDKDGGRRGIPIELAALRGVDEGRLIDIGRLGTSTETGG